MAAVERVVDGKARSDCWVVPLNDVAGSVATPAGGERTGRSLTRCSTTATQPFQQVHQITACGSHDRSAVRRAVTETLVDGVVGRSEDAITELCRMHRTGCASVALEALTEDANELFRRLEARSQYPIPLRYVMDRLDVRSEDDFELCVSSLRRLAAPDAQRSCAAPSVTLRNDDLDELVAAFHVMTALVRFAAARWWIHPESVLRRLHLDTCAEGAAQVPSAAQDGSKR